MTNLEAAHSGISRDRPAVITGGGNGIGLAVATMLLDAGMTVWLLDRDVESLEAARSKLGAPPQLFVREVDVADLTAMKAVAAEVEQPVGFLMNGAAIADRADALSDPAAWARLINVNLLGMVNGLNAFAPSMINGNLPGAIVNVGSKQGITQPPGSTSYNVSKAGVKALTEGLAHTLREQVGDRITAHLLIPGFTYSKMVARYFSERPEGAWTTDQVAHYLFEGIRSGEFYILCPDNETTAEMDRKRIRWALEDLLKGRPALSRWHPEFKDEFEAFMDAPE